MRATRPHEVTALTKMDKPTPRINAPLREKFIGTHTVGGKRLMLGQTVRIIGKPLQFHGDTATIDANGEIKVHLMRVFTRRCTSGTDC